MLEGAHAVPPEALRRRLTADERCVLALVDGRHTLGEIVDVSGTGRRRTVQAIAGLLRAGLIKVACSATSPDAPRRIDRSGAGMAAATTARPATSTPDGSMLPDRQPTTESGERQNEPLDAVTRIPLPTPNGGIPASARAAAVEATSREPGGDVPRTTLRRALATFIPFVRPYWLRFSVAVLAVIATSFVGLLKPWPLKFLVDNVLAVQPATLRPASLSQTIGLIAGSIVVIAFVLGLLSYVKQYVLAATSQRVAFRLRSVLFAHLQRLPLAFHDRQRTGDLMTRVTNDVTKVQELVTDDLLLGGVTSLVQLVGMLAVMLIVDWKLGLVASASAPLIILTTRYYRRMIRQQEQQVRAREGDIASLTQETIASIRVVKAFGRAEFETQRFEEQTGAMVDAGIKASRIEALFGWTLSLVNAAVLAAVVAVGAYQVLAGALSTGTLIVFIQYMRDLQSPLLSLSKLSAKVAKVTVRADRLLEILNERPSVEEAGNAVPAPPLGGRIRFERVSFGYAAAAPVLHEIDFEIEPGQRVALVGQTGAGKSTIAALLLRLYDPTAGRILIDGQDVRRWTLASLIGQIGVVLQEALLFRTTIRENIAYGRPSASLDEIQRAAEVADCREFVERLPDKFETVIGERGGTLSGGQRQRIAIARAVIRNPPILILDEPTTGLDAVSEHSVVQALDRLAAGKTTIMISHNLDLIRTADQILMLVDGRIAEAGTHDELIRSGGHYASLYQLYRSDRLLAASTQAEPRPRHGAANGHRPAHATERRAGGAGPGT